MRIKIYTEVYSQDDKEGKRTAIDLDRIQRITEDTHSTEIELKPQGFMRVRVKEPFEQVVADWEGKNIQPHLPAIPHFQTVYLKECDLEIRTKNTLIRNGIKTTEQLESKTEEEVRNLRNMGRKSFAYLKGFMAKKGLHFKDEK